VAGGPRPAGRAGADRRLQSRRRQRGAAGRPPQGAPVERRQDLQPTLPARRRQVLGPRRQEAAHRARRRRQGPLRAHSASGSAVSAPGGSRGLRRRLAREPCPAQARGPVERQRVVHGQDPGRGRPSRCGQSAPRGPGAELPDRGRDRARAQAGRGFAQAGGEDRRRRGPPGPGRSRRPSPARQCPGRCPTRAVSQGPLGGPPHGPGQSAPGFPEPAFREACPGHVHPHVGPELRLVLATRRRALRAGELQGRERG